MLVSKFGRMGIKKVEMIKTRMNKKIKSLNFCDDSMQKGDFEDEHPGTWMPEDTAKRNPLDRCISLRDT